MAELVCDCDDSGACTSPGSVTKNVGDSWTIYGAWWCYMEGGLCSATTSIYLQIYTTSWVNVSSSTPIKTSSTNPVTKRGGYLNWNTCNPLSSPNASWTVQVNTGASGSYSMRINTVYGAATFTVTVNESAATRKSLLPLTGAG